MIEDRPQIVSALPVKNGDRLRVAFWNSSNAISPELFVRYLIQFKDGTRADGSEAVVVPASTIEQIIYIPLTEGDLLWITVDTGQTTPQSGLIFSSIALLRGAVDNAQSRISLMSGYISTATPLIYPLSTPSASNSGPGALVSVTGTDPGAGFQFSLALNSIANIELLNVNFILTTDATVASRLPFLNLTDTTGIVFRSAANAVQLLSTLVRYSFNQWPATPFSPANNSYGVIPKHTTSSGATLAISVDNFQAGDSLNQIRIKYRNRSSA